MGDIRLDRLNTRMFEQVVATGSLVLKTVGGDRKGEIAFNRFIDNDGVDFEMILAGHIERTRQAAAGCTVVVAQDTTEINFSGRAVRRTGLGPAGDGVSPGFFIHPQLVIDAGTEAVLGLAGAEIWTRDAVKARPRRGREAGEKESQRWLTGAKIAAERLDTAARIVMVGDRESDIYAFMARRPPRTELILRAAQDRALAGGMTVKTVADSWPELARQTVTVAARRIGQPGGPKPARTAHVTIRAGRIEVLRPARTGNRSDKASLTLNLVAVSEVNPPPGIEPLCWWLLTTLPVETTAEALEVVRLYRLRWRIEEVFRTLKTDGLDLEASQVTTANRLFNLAALGLAASVRIIQLVDARDGSERPATDVIDPASIAAATVIGRGLEGTTPRQKNPHPIGKLSWLSWIVARLGGWNCYYRPPGPKTIANGWRRFNGQLEGFHLAKAVQHV